MIDSKSHLRCLSLKPNFRFFAISSSPFGSQMIRGTIGSTSVSGSVAAVDESAIEFSLVLSAEEDVEEAEVDEDASGEAGAFLVG